MTTELVEKARNLAAEAHAGQLDAQGRDYFEAHLAPIAAGCRALDPGVEATGWLHDILEDTDVTVEQLLDGAFPADIVSAVISVTKRASEAYPELIERAGADAVGRYVKWVDNAWNIVSSPTLSLIDPARAHRMLYGKYLPARTQLRAACGDLPFDDLASESLEDVFARFRSLLPDTRAWAGAMKLEVWADGNALNVFGEDQTSAYGSQQYNFSFSLSHTEFSKIRYALNAHPLIDICQLVLRHSEEIFGKDDTQWFTEHGIEFRTDAHRALR